jgi:hypothetical protein
MFSVHCQWSIEPCLMQLWTFLWSHEDENWRVELIWDNLTFNFNSLLRIVYVSFSMPNFQRRKNVISTGNFYFDEYVAISHRYDLKRVSLLKWLYWTSTLRLWRFISISSTFPSISGLRKVKQLVWFKNHTSLHYLAEPSHLHFNRPITPCALTFIQETSCKLFVNT